MRFHPWVGHEYLAQQQRWLVLGESHYGDPAAVDQTFTQQVTRDYVTGDVQHAFWTKVANLFLEDGANAQAQRAFWHRVRNLRGRVPSGLRMSSLHRLRTPSRRTRNVGVEKHSSWMSKN